MDTIEVGDRVNVLLYPATEANGIVQEIIGDSIKVDCGEMGIWWTSVDMVIQE